ncbi:MAG: hypothetical protein KGL39_50820 [Patescibacteria group bacterium]|mgnify:CR=1 FL=1|nr:hypothetical protein [Patescibacteria group bacterium]
MNGSPATTAGVAITGGGLGDLISWLCQVAHLPVPPQADAVVLGALVLSGAHLLVNWIDARFPAPTPKTGA